MGHLVGLGSALGAQVCVGGGGPLRLRLLGGAGHLGPAVAADLLAMIGQCVVRVHLNGGGFLSGEVQPGGGAHIAKRPDGGMKNRSNPQPLFLFFLLFEVTCVTNLEFFDACVYV